MSLRAASSSAILGTSFAATESCAPSPLLQRPFSCDPEQPGSSDQPGFTESDGDDAWSTFKQYVSESDHTAARGTRAPNFFEAQQRKYRHCLKAADQLLTKLKGLSAVCERQTSASGGNGFALESNPLSPARLKSASNLAKATGRGRMEKARLEQNMKDFLKEYSPSKASAEQKKERVWTFTPPCRKEKEYNSPRWCVFREQVSASSDASNRSGEPSSNSGMHAIVDGKLDLKPGLMLGTAL